MAAGRDCHPFRTKPKSGIPGFPEPCQRERNCSTQSASLCDGFPQETSAAYLAYAQSYSFTRYLREKYGARGLSELLATYSEKVGCEEGTKVAMGVPLPELEADWKQEELGIHLGKRAWTNLSPYFLLFAGFILLLITPLIPVF